MFEDLLLSVQWRLPSVFQKVRTVTLCQMCVWLPPKCYSELPVRFVLGVLRTRTLDVVVVSRLGLRTCAFLLWG